MTLRTYARRPPTHPQGGLRRRLTVILGEHLKKRRMELGLFQRQAAVQLGICQFTYIGWETGKKKPFTHSYARIVGFLGYDPMPVPATLGERIKAKRRELGMTQKQLADLFGWDEATVFRYERNEWVPKGQRLQRLEAFLIRQ
jgi:DNA-binding XRE family transcriptional regulator